MTELPQHCGRGIPAPCGCVWEAGSWDICAMHRIPHNQHANVTPAPWCPECNQLYQEDLGDQNCADDAEAYGEALREIYDL